MFVLTQIENILSELMDLQTENGRMIKVLTNKMIIINKSLRN